jgi:murein DD-endopeptidase MepM/ murein hydrolase activator NlpD
VPDTRFAPGRAYACGLAAICATAYWSAAVNPATADAEASERQDQLFESRASESGARRGIDPAEPAAEEPPADEPPADDTDSPKSGGGTRALRLRLENVTPQKIFFRGSKAATFEYEIAGRQARDLVIEVVPKGGGEVIQRWQAKDVEPGRSQTQTWGGKTRAKDSARSGAYLFRVREKGGALARRSTSDGKHKAEGDRSFGYYDHVFPIRGKHTYGDGVGAGRGHQGQDVFADCGRPLEAARAGKVQFRGYQGSGAGYYVVIDGKKTGRDYVYMHLQGKANIGEGGRVRTGERIGKVGESGNASGCHLHFELWSPPGWYQGGDFLRSVTRQLKRWDRWS